MTHLCARCRRPITSPVVVEGKGYGPLCALKVKPADLLTQKKKRRGRLSLPRRMDARQPGLFEEVRA